MKEFLIIKNAATSLSVKKDGENAAVIYSSFFDRSTNEYTYVDITLNASELLSAIKALGSTHRFEIKNNSDELQCYQLGINVYKFVLIKDGDGIYVIDNVQCDLQQMVQNI